MAVSSPKSTEHVEERLLGYNCDIPRDSSELRGGTKSHKGWGILCRVRQFSKQSGWKRNKWKADEMESGDGAQLCLLDDSPFRILKVKARVFGNCFIVPSSICIQGYCDRICLHFFPIFFLIVIISLFYFSF